jgi:inhibitor of cysteine peptidase
MRFFAPALGLLLLMSCASQSEGPTPKANGAIAAPTAKDDVVHVTSADAGKVVTVKVGQTLAVELVGIPTAGYLWAPVSTPAFLAQSGERSGPTSEAQKQPGFAGGRHWEVTLFTATGAGQGELKFEQRRPWEKDEPPTKVFAVTIEAK